MTDSVSNNSVRKHQPALGLRLDFGSQPCPLCFDSLLACSLNHGQDVKLVSRFSQPSDITIRLELELELELNPDREEFASWLDVNQLPLKDDILLVDSLRSPPVIDIIQLEDDPTLPILVCAPCAVVHVNLQPCLGTVVVVVSLHIAMFSPLALSTLAAG
jgi:hypothetical protein